VKRYSEEQIISIFKEHEADASVPDLARRHGIAENTIYRQNSKYGGVEVSQTKRLRDLEQENARLKRLQAEAELEKAALKVLNRSQDLLHAGGRYFSVCPCTDFHRPGALADGDPVGAEPQAPQSCVVDPLAAVALGALVAPG